jgi:hypothetical protein
MTGMEKKRELRTHCQRACELILAKEDVHHEDSTPTHGYAATREAATAAFAKSWRQVGGPLRGANRKTF